MQESPYSPNDTKPTPRRKRAALRASLMIVIAGLVLLLVLLLLSSLVKPAAPEAKIPPDQNVIEPTQTSEAPQPAVVPADGSPEDGNANPAIAPEETGNRFIDASGSSSGLFGQLSQEALSEFQTCADELEYTARIDDTWDIWELIFYTIYADQDNASTTPPACQQLASKYSTGGRAEFMTALGADWWPEGNFPTELYFPADAICISYEACKQQCASDISFPVEEVNGYVLYQQLLNSNTGEMSLSCVGFEAQLFLNALGNAPESVSNLITCTHELVPSSMCHRDFRFLLPDCSESIDWLGDPAELETIIKSEFASNFGDIPSSCIEYVSLNILGGSAFTHTDFGINNGAGCTTGSQDCRTVYSVPLTIEAAQECADLLEWPHPITSDSHAIDVIEYLAASAPWLPPGSMPPSCTQLLISASPTEAGAAYWELLGKTLSERRIDTLP